EKRTKLVPSSSSDAWSYPYNQSNFTPIKKDNHYGDYSFGGCLPRPTLIPPPLPLVASADAVATTTT
ncbi:unnamed protein product, partial [Rotaria magnacalcarata]